MHSLTAITTPRRGSPPVAVVEAVRLLDVFLEELRRRRIDGSAVDILVEEAALLRPHAGTSSTMKRAAFPVALTGREEQARHLLGLFAAQHARMSAKEATRSYPATAHLAGVIVALRNLLDLPGALASPGNVIRHPFTR